MAKNSGTITPSTPAPAPVAKATEVMVNWKEARLLVVHPSQSGSMLSKLGGSNAVLTPEQVKEELEQHKPLTILPGIHAYPAHLWAMAAAHPVIKTKLRDEQLVVITNGLVGKVTEGEKAAEPAAAMPGTLEKVSTSNARDIVEGCLDQELLGKWLEAEKAGQNRPSVLDALKSQMDLLAETDRRFKGEE